MHWVHQVFMNNIMFAGFILQVFLSVYRFGCWDTRFIFCSRPVESQGQSRTPWVLYFITEELVSYPRIFISRIYWLLFMLWTRLRFRVGGLFRGRIWIGQCWVLKNLISVTIFVRRSPGAVSGYLPLGSRCRPVTPKCLGGYWRREQRGSAFGCSC